MLGTSEGSVLSNPQRCLAHSRMMDREKSRHIVAVSKDYIFRPYPILYSSSLAVKGH